MLMSPELFMDYWCQQCCFITNYLQIINYIENKEVKKTELDLSMYIVEIAKKEYSELVPIIQQKLTVFKDKDAIEDLEIALKKITS